MSLLHWYYDPLRLPSRNAPFHFNAYRFVLYDFVFVVQGRVSLVPVTSLSTCRSLYTGEFFCVVISKVSTHSMAFTLALGARLSLVALSGAIDDAAGFT